MSRIEDILLKNLEVIEETERAIARLKMRLHETEEELRRIYRKLEENKNV